MKNLELRTKILLREIKRISGNEGDRPILSATSNTQAGNGTVNFGLVETTVNGRLVVPNQNRTDNTLLTNRLNNLRNSRPVEGAGVTKAPNVGLPQRDSRRNVVERSISAVDSIAGGMTESVTSRVSLASIFFFF